MTKRGAKGVTQKSVNDIEAKLDDAAHGLAALKSLIDDLEAKLDHASHGLVALKALIDAVEGKLDDPSHGLANLKALIDALEAKLDDGTIGLAALKTLIDAIEAKLDDGTIGLAALRALIVAVGIEVAAVEAKLDHATYGLARLMIGINTAIMAVGTHDMNLNSKYQLLNIDLDKLLTGIIQGTGTVLPANKSLYDVIALDRLDHATYGLGKLLIAINTAIALVNTHNTNLNDIYSLLSLDIADIESKLDNGTYGLSALNTDLDKLLTGTIQGTGTVLPANKSLYDILWADRNLDESGSFNWDTSVYTTSETDISALFTTDLTGTKRRKYWVYLALHNVEGDANFDECYIRIYVKINGTYQCIDKATKTDANLIVEPGVPVEVPPTAEDAKITLEMKTALAGDQTIDYGWVEEKMEY